MKAIFLYVLLFLTLAACGTTTHKKVESEWSDQKVQEFKIVFFKSCVNKSLEEDALFSHDISYSHDYALGTKNYMLIDSLANIVNTVIIKDSIERQSKICPQCNESEIQRMRNEGLIGKRTLKYCLEYYSSFELDSIAKIHIK